MSIYAYMRVSTRTQAENNGTEMQEAEIKKYCASNDITLAGTFSDEGISGTVADRPGLLDLFSALEKGDKIIVQNTSRLWRNDSVKVMVHHELKRIGADVLSIEQPSYTVYSCDPTDFLFNGMMELLDQYERMTIAMKLAKGRRARAKTGKKPCGTAPYGYRWTNDAEIEIDYNNHLIVQQIFEMYINFQSLQRLAAYCEMCDWRTRHGKPFSKSALHKILTNDFYLGIVTHAGIKTQGTHQPIIDRQTFDRVQAILRG